MKLEKLVDFKKMRFFPGQFGGGPWTGLGPGDVPLFPRDISTQEIYAFDLHLPVSRVTAVVVQGEVEKEFTEVTLTIERTAHSIFSSHHDVAHC
jgi:hypothetical protein